MAAAQRHRIFSKEIIGDPRLGFVDSKFDRKEDVEMGDLFNRLSFPFLFLQNLAVRRGASVTLCPSKKKTSNFQLPNLH